MLPEATAIARDADGFPLGLPLFEWRDDAQLGTELLVVNNDLFLSYRARGRVPLDPALALEARHWDLLLGIEPGREETAIMRRRRPTLVLLGDLRSELAAAAHVGEFRLAHYYDHCARRCPKSRRRWSDTDDD